MPTIDPLYLTLGLFAGMLLLMMTGTPLGWALMIVASSAAYWLWGASGLLLMVTSAFESMNNFILVSLPLFVFMGVILQRSGVTDNLFDMVYKLMGGIPGGLGAGTVVISALIACMAGVSGAATLSLGIIALPSMLKRGYDKKLVSGAIMAGGALGLLIPPSVLMLIYAFLAKESVGRLFAAGVVPGFMLAGIYIAYVLIRSAMNPSLAPPIPVAERVGFRDKIISMKSLILPGLLIVAVLGFIILGITTPAEASAVGAAGSLVCAWANGNLNYRVVSEAAIETTKLMGMVFLVTFSAVFFSKIYLGLGAGQLIVNVFEDMQISGIAVICIMMAVIFFLSMFMDDFAITFITVPLFVPIVQQLGFDTIWFATLFIVMMQTAYLTPPFGYNLFYMKSVAPKEIALVDLYKAALPFVALQLVGVILVLLFPSIALWLPNLLFGAQ